MKLLCIFYIIVQFLALNAWPLAPSRNISSPNPLLNFSQETPYWQNLQEPDLQSKAAILFKEAQVRIHKAGEAGYLADLNDDTIEQFLENLLGKDKPQGDDRRIWLFLNHYLQAILCCQNAFAKPDASSTYSRDYLKEAYIHFNGALIFLGTYLQQELKQDQASTDPIKAQEVRELLKEISNNPQLLNKDFRELLGLFWSDYLPTQANKQDEQNNTENLLNEFIQTLKLFGKYELNSESHTLWAKKWINIVFSKLFAERTDNYDEWKAAIINSYKKKPELKEFLDLPNTVKHEDAANIQNSFLGGIKPFFSKQAEMSLIFNYSSLNNLLKFILNEETYDGFVKDMKERALKRPGALYVEYKQSIPEDQSHQQQNTFFSNILFIIHSIDRAFLRASDNRASSLIKQLYSTFKEMPTALTDLSFTQHLHVANQALTDKSIELNKHYDATWSFKPSLQSLDFTLQSLEKIASQPRGQETNEFIKRIVRRRKIFHESSLLYGTFGDSSLFNDFPITASKDNLKTVSAHCLSDLPTAKVALQKHASDRFRDFNHAEDIDPDNSLMQIDYWEEFLFMLHKRILLGYNGDPEENLTNTLSLITLAQTKAKSINPTAEAQHKELLIAFFEQCLLCNQTRFAEQAYEMLQELKIKFSNNLYEDYLEMRYHFANGSTEPPKASWQHFYNILSKIRTASRIKQEQLKEWHLEGFERMEQSLEPSLRERPEYQQLILAAKNYRTDHTQHEQSSSLGELRTKHGQTSYLPVLEEEFEELFSGNDKDRRVFNNLVLDWSNWRSLNTPLIEQLFKHEHELEITDEARVIDFLNAYEQILSQNAHNDIDLLTIDHFNRTFVFLMDYYPDLLEKRIQNVLADKLFAYFQKYHSHLKPEHKDVLLQTYLKIFNQKPQQLSKQVKVFQQFWLTKKNHSSNIFEWLYLSTLNEERLKDFFSNPFHRLDQLKAFDKHSRFLKALIPLFGLSKLQNPKEQDIQTHLSLANTNIGLKAQTQTPYMLLKTFATYTSQLFPENTDAHEHPFHKLFHSILEDLLPIIQKQIEDQDDPVFKNPFKRHQNIDIQVQHKFDQLLLENRDQCLAFLQKNQNFLAYNSDIFNNPKTQHFFNTIFQNEKDLESLSIDLENLRSKITSLFEQEAYPKSRPIFYRWKRKTHPKDQSSDLELETVWQETLEEQLDLPNSLSVESLSADFPWPESPLYTQLKNTWRAFPSKDQQEPSFRNLKLILSYNGIGKGVSNKIRVTNHILDIILQNNSAEISELKRNLQETLKALELQEELSELADALRLGSEEVKLKNHNQQQNTVTLAKKIIDDSTDKYLPTQKKEMQRALSFFQNRKFLEARKAYLNNALEKGKAISIEDLQRAFTQADIFQENSIGNVENDYPDFLKGSLSLEGLQHNMLEDFDIAEDFSGYHVIPKQLSEANAEVLELLEDVLEKEMLWVALGHTDISDQEAWTSYFQNMLEVLSEHRAHSARAIYLQLYFETMIQSSHSEDEIIYKKAYLFKQTLISNPTLLIEWQELLKCEDIGDLKKSLLKTERFAFLAQYLASSVHYNRWLEQNEPDINKRRTHYAYLGEALYQRRLNLDLSKDSTKHTLKDLLLIREYFKKSRTLRASQNSGFQSPQENEYIELGLQTKDVSKTELIVLVWLAQKAFKDPQKEVESLRMDIEIDETVISHLLIMPQLLTSQQYWDRAVELWHLGKKESANEPEFQHLRLKYVQNYLLRHAEHLVFAKENHEQAIELYNEALQILEKLSPKPSTSRNRGKKDRKAQKTIFQNNEIELIKALKSKIGSTISKLEASGSIDPKLAQTHDQMHKLYLVLEDLKQIWPHRQLDTNQNMDTEETYDIPRFNSTWQHNNDKPGQFVRTLETHYATKFPTKEALKLDWISREEHAQAQLKAITDTNVWFSVQVALAELYEALFDHHIKVINQQKSEDPALGNFKDPYAPQMLYQSKQLYLNAQSAPKELLAADAQKMYGTCFESTEDRACQLDRLKHKAQEHNIPWEKEKPQSKHGKAKSSQTSSLSPSLIQDLNKTWQNFWRHDNFDWNKITHLEQQNALKIQLIKYRQQLESLNKKISIICFLNSFPQSFVLKNFAPLFFRSLWLRQYGNSTMMAPMKPI